MAVSKKTNVALIWRGALGGVLGAPLFLIGLALHDKLRMGYIPYGGGLEILALPTFLLVGAVFGAAVGGIIWVFVRLIGPARLPAIIRAIIGASFILIGLGLLQMLRSEVNSGVIPPTPMEAAINVLMYIVSFGALPGIAARPGILEDGTRSLPQRRRTKPCS
jgi:hypothetical protein